MQILTAEYGTVGGKIHGLTPCFSADLAVDAFFALGSIPRFSGTALLAATRTGGFPQGIREPADAIVVAGGHTRLGTATGGFRSRRRGKRIRNAHSYWNAK